MAIKTEKAVLVSFRDQFYGSAYRRITITIRRLLCKRQLCALKRQLSALAVVIIITIIIISKSYIAHAPTKQGSEGAEYNTNWKHRLPRNVVYAKRTSKSYLLTRNICLLNSLFPYCRLFAYSERSHEIGPSNFQLLLSVRFNPTYSQIKLLSDIYCISYSLIRPN